MAELYPAEVRATGLSIPYNFAVTIFGGFAPFIVTWAIARTGSPLAPAWYVMAAAALSAIAVILMREAGRGYVSSRSSPTASTSTRPLVGFGAHGTSRESPHS